MATTWTEYVRQFRNPLLTENRFRRVLVAYQMWRHERSWQSPGQRYGFALGITAVILSIRLLLDTVYPASSPFLFFTLALILSVWFAGLGAGVFTAALTILAVDYFFLPPRYTFFLEGPLQVLEILLFLFQGTVITVLIIIIRYNQYLSQQNAVSLQVSNDHFRALIDGVSDYAIYMIDRKGYILSWSDAAAKIKGYSADEVLGRKISIFYPPEEISAGKPERDLQIAEKLGRLEEECWIIRKDGSAFWASSIITALRDERGTVRGFARVTRDMTERKKAEDTIKHQAYHDALTGLPNRMNLQETLLSTLRWASRHQETVGVIFLDLDRFKSINDTLGHHLGDLLLKEVSTRLGTAVRTQDFVARFGGDEFVIILRGIRHITDTIKVAESILTSLRPSFTLDGQPYHISTSIGISIYPQDGNDVATLLKNADAALYQSKRSGRDMVTFYSKGINAKASHRLNLENELRQALARNQLHITYQPIVTISRGKLVSAEALIRWDHPELGPISPTEFIPIAEDSGLIFSIGDWVIDTVCNQQAIWKKRKLRTVPIAINLSARQFAHSQLVRKIEHTLNSTGIDPKMITVEVTESVAMNDINTAIAKLTAINRLGVTAAIDDFGTGFSSLNYLKQLPITKLKIDRSFLENAPTSSKDMAIIKAIISVGRSLKLKVIAEGIEREDQLNFLRGTHCDWGQGFLFSEALDAQMFEDWLRTGN